ncbi:MULTISPECIES: LysR family transcriptional regulator [unclassified Bosea (in: a-proteobacteria)]|uniref:LysR family transcriptional regulator n=1 Tax=unclassified Bosea (in: a-proteobacteria) TaxID=2653178 RepID=UPI000F761A9D|nr:MULTISPECIES: LysR family transcriptional regulator [unclassified Bosea (in: a-proteobacteria)]AZO79271.1 LysR family transcriptional regulator [Bosea sp. Tri-49]RXT27326.1 LysR family transcriptional regulator [Bosea sp. Tri-39]RXT35969.1 LysR family transcriptional regulator [Bosea sp. Tri-54]
MLDLVLLRNFAVIARTGSISLASLQIGRTQSALSMQMQRLEDQIGQPLLHRSGSGVHLTTAGHKFLAQAEALLAAHDEVLADMRGTGLKGALNLGCPEDYSIAFLPNLLRSFCALHPDVELRMVCAPTSELRPLLHRRQIEMALVSLADASSTEVIRPERFVWVANEAQPAILHSANLPLALSAPMTLDHRAACDAMEAVGRRYRIAFASNSLAGLIAIARSGHAISVLTETAVPPDLHVVHVGLPPLPSIGIAVEFADQRPSAAAKALSEHIKAELPRL